MAYDIFGIGNPLIDILVEVNEDFIEKHSLTKGNFNMLSQEVMEGIMDELKDMKIVVSPGDSSANTLVGVCNLGGSAIYAGKIGEDVHGEYYETKLTEKNIKSQLVKTNLPTGKAICLITPDAQRTFGVYLGASVHLSSDDILEDDVKQCKIVHLTGYQLEDPNLRKTSLHLIELAKKHGKKVSIDVADPGLVERNLEDLKIILKDADIIFANETEAKALTGKEEIEALYDIAELADVAIVKIGAKGSFISENGSVINVDGVKANAIDTTGAGDMYAAGILFGITHNIPLEDAGKIASYSAAKVVEQKSARLSFSLKDKIKEIIE